MNPSRNYPYPTLNFPPRIFAKLIPPWYLPPAVYTISKLAFSSFPVSIEGAKPRIPGSNTIINSQNEECDH